MSPLVKNFDFSKTESQSFIIHTIRFAFLVLVFLFILSMQVLETRVDAARAFHPLYVLIASSFFVQFVFIIFFRSFYKNLWISGGLFYLESIYITCLIYLIGIQQSVLIFLYLVNLILMGILFQRKGAMPLALWTSVLFSFMVSLDTSLDGTMAYLAVGVNNLAFFTVAYLAGFLSEQLNIMGVQLKESVRDIKMLKNINELILMNMHSGLITVDLTGEILQMNPQAKHLLKIHKDRASEKNISEFLPELDIDLNRSTDSFDLQMKREGEKRILNISLSHLVDEENYHQGHIISLKDETHLRTLEKRVRQSEKMAAIGQLATGIAHEIRNPLAGISGSVQLLQDNDSDAEQTQKLMGIVCKEIDRLNLLITEFLDFAKPEAPMEDHILLSDLLEELLEFTGQDWKQKNVAFQMEKLGDSPVLGNRDKLKQAFLNILVNAFQAVEGKPKASVSVTVKKNGKRVSVKVCDNGVGMGDELIERIFEPFHTTKHKGTGLGLAITHSIFESHGATIQVDSELGKGTEFNIQFKTLSP